MQRFSGYDESEYADNGTDDAIEEVVNDYTDEAIDDELSEAEQRLSRALYYKEIIKGGDLFGDGSKEAQEISEELRQFARQRMADLLGLSKPKEKEPVQVPQFTDEQVAVIKALADKIIAKQQEPQPATPVMKSIEPPKAPAVAKPQAPKAVVEPKKLEVPQKEKPVVAKPKAAPVKKAAAKPAKAAKPVVKSDEPLERGDTPYENLPLGEVFKDNDGKLYKMVENPIAGGSKYMRISVKRNQNGAGRKPMPTGAAFTLLSESQARETINGNVDNPLLIQAAALSATSNNGDNE